MYLHEQFPGPRSQDVFVVWAGKVDLVDIRLDNVIKYTLFVSYHSQMIDDTIPWHTFSGDSVTTKQFQYF